jgi:GTP1/Obg family GTP-binding protein
MYLPQFYRENFDYVNLVLKTLSADVIEQYQTEEQTAMTHRVFESRRQLLELFNIMTKDDLSEHHKIKRLREELNAHFNTSYFSKCATMGSIVKRQLKKVLQKHLPQVKTA